MPKYTAFVSNFGRSSRYSRRKKNKNRTQHSRNHGNQAQNDIHVSQEISSSSESDTERTVENAIDMDCHANHDALHRDLHSARSDSDGIGIAIDSDEDLASTNDFGAYDDMDLEFDAEDSSGSDSDDDDDEPLYKGAPITFGESMMTIFTFALTNNLTGAAISSLLLLISMHCIQPNRLKKSLYLFRKYFDNIRYPIIKHYYCSVHFLPLRTVESPCAKCKRRKGVSYFIEIPLLFQLQILFKRRGLYESLRHRFHRVKINWGNLEDIYDADAYAELSREGEFLSSPDNVSFMWNTDGVPIFKSSGFQIWPFYLVINELPFHERYKSENILLAGLWFGPHKPCPNIFLDPLKSTLNEIFEGVYLNVPSRDVPVKLRGIVLCGTCDLPAKSLFLNMTQFNGNYGCPKCKLRGQSVEGVWTYPFVRNLNRRTEEETRVHAEEARIDAPVYGIKGPSVLDLFVHKYIRTTAVDSMHCVFMGVVKKLCSFFFDSSYSDHPASLYYSVDLVDARLCSLSPPSFVKRRPRSIKNHFKYWKASECKAWFFQYSLAILHDIMLPAYFEHYSMFVLAVYALNQNSISPEMLEYSTRLLTEFVNRFDVLYGERYMSCNLHQLLHLPETVRDFGPLWVTSCFAFEDLNGKLKRLVHSSRHPELQICSAVSSLLNLSSLRHEKLRPGSAPYLYCSTLSNARRKIRLKTILDGIGIVGKCSKVDTLPDIVSLSFDRDDIAGRKFETFTRLFKDRLLYASESYTRSVKYNNTCVRYNSNGAECIGIIHSFYKVYQCLCQLENMCECHTPTYAIIRQCEVSSFISQNIQEGLPVTILECTGVDTQAAAVPVDQLISVCYSLKISDLGKHYIAFPTNSMEIE